MLISNEGEGGFIVDVDSWTKASGMIGDVVKESSGEGVTIEV